MTPFTALLAAALAWGPARAATLPGVGPDSLEAVEHARFVLLQYYRSASQWSSRGDRRRRDALGQPFDRLCDGNRDDACFGGDPDAGRCPNLVRCHPSPQRMLEALLEATSDHPDSGFLTGQTVYLLSKLDRVADAARVARGCRAAAWWCDALTGYVLHGMGREPEADAALRRALAAAPDSIRCVLTDPTWVLGSWSQRGANTSVPDAYKEAEDWDCARRTALADTVWWLSDPLYSVPGNNRFVEHVARAMSARFQEEIRLTLPGSLGPRRYGDYLRAARVRRGFVDSYDGNRGVSWTSHASARYHFVPDVGLDGLASPTWRLDAGLDDEGYTPGTQRFTPLPHQIARFRAGDSLRVVAATRTAGSPLAGALDAQAAFVLTDGPGSMPLHILAEVGRTTTTFLGQVPPRAYVASVELVTSKGVGWGRTFLRPLSMAGPELSDLMLYAPGGEDAPTDLMSAAAVMRGTTRLDKDQGLGLFWETYGVPANADLSFELSVERDSGGLVDRIRRLIPGGGNDERGTIRWSEPSSGAVHGSAIAVDVHDLDGGTYALVLRASWDGGPTLERRRRFEIE